MIRLALAVMLTLTACAVADGGDTETLLPSGELPTTAAPTTTLRPLSAADLAACADHLHQAEMQLDAEMLLDGATSEIPLSTEEMRNILRGILARYVDRTCAPTLRSGYDYCAEIASVAAELVARPVLDAEVDVLTTECYEDVRGGMTSTGLTYDDGWEDGHDCGAHPSDSAYRRCLADYRAGVRPVPVPRETPPDNYPPPPP